MVGREAGKGRGRENGRETKRKRRGRDRPIDLWIFHPPAYPTKGLTAKSVLG